MLYTVKYFQVEPLEENYVDRINDLLVSSSREIILTGVKANNEVVEDHSGNFLPLVSFRQILAFKYTYSNVCDK